MPHNHLVQYSVYTVQYLFIFPVLKRFILTAKAPPPGNIEAQYILR